jgi:hypothetical protein
LYAVQQDLGHLPSVRNWGEIVFGLPRRLLDDLARDLLSF